MQIFKRQNSQCITKVTNYKSSSGSNVASSAAQAVREWEGAAKG